MAEMYGVCSHTTHQQNAGIYDPNAMYFRILTGFDNILARYCRIDMNVSSLVFYYARHRTTSKIKTKTGKEHCRRTN